ncbi:membrane protein [Rhodopirellula sallentina SM41]|uniref:Membrane protein n=2 Tax=Rhodopirellula TaxID=265488 RepID=M5U675_9BACT|nr:membrane protein [Rhodopirellula sallentina SM41]
MTDSEFNEWTDVRARGIRYFRRKCFVINTIVAAVGILVLAVVKYTEFTPLWVRLMLPDVVIPCMIGLPFLLHFFFTPMMWQSQEQQYLHTLDLRVKKDKAASRGV